MSKGNVLSLFDYTGNMVRPWAEAGYTCDCIDLKHPGNYAEEFGEGAIFKSRADVMSFNTEACGPYDIVFAAPPCTDLAVSGARWFKSKGMKRLIEALTLVERARVICEESGAPYVIENPVSTLSTYWRKPDYTFDPSDYAGYLDDPTPEAYKKKTCLWTGNGFVMPAPKPVTAVLGSKMHLLPPTDDRAELRSATPLGFARAVFEANRKDEENAQSKAA